MPAATLAALLGATGILVRGFVDFNLQIPANAALFYLLAAIIENVMGSAGGGRGKRPPPRTQVRRILRSYPSLMRPENSAAARQFEKATSGNHLPPGDTFWCGFSACGG